MIDCAWFGNNANVVVFVMETSTSWKQSVRHALCFDWMMIRAVWLAFRLVPLKTIQQVKICNWKIGKNTFHWKTIIE